MEKGSIKKQLVSGVFYTAIAKYTGIVISIVITGVLSRILTPEDFGTIVPIMVLMPLFTILGDMGIGPAVLQNKELS
ncbi:MAG: oligosaccharide flippase family protein, partial [Alistipes sp.]